jgi:hypothetical protein
LFETFWILISNSLRLIDGREIIKNWASTTNGYTQVDINTSPSEDIGSDNVNEHINDCIQNDVEQVNNLLVSYFYNWNYYLKNFSDISDIVPDQCKLNLNLCTCNFF